MTKFKLPAHHDTIVNCAVRYALGRRSYIVGMMIDYVLANYDTLGKECKDIIKSDIEDAMCRGDIGDKTDEIQWIALLKWMNIQGGKTCLKKNRL